MRFWIAFSFVFLFVVAGCSASDQTTKLTIATAHGPIDFETEIARTPLAQERGLMFRDSMAANHAMLFPLPRETVAQFWMKNTHIPLDMLFIRTDGVIVHIHAMAQPYDETLISSVKPVKMVLEISGGEAAKQGIAVGDRLLLPKDIK